MIRRLPTLPPLTRGECREWALTCRLTSCRYHLRHDDHPGKADGKNEPWDGCALDYAEDRGPMTYQDVASLMGVTDSAILDTERRALRKLARAAVRLRDAAPERERGDHWSETEESW